MKWEVLKLDCLQKIPPVCRLITMTDIGLPERVQFMMSRRMKFVSNDIESRLTWSLSIAALAIQVSRFFTASFS